MKPDMTLRLDERFISETLLGSCDFRPKWLFAIGNTELLKAPAIAIVGTRRASAYGIRAVSTFSRALARTGLVVISGLARGIDRFAHEGALDVGGKTIAVLGCGLNEIYPRENTALANRILEQDGCLLSEYPAFTPPLKHHFPERNRIVAGLSLGTLVIEAGLKSGSLITAQIAVDAAREVFILPGLWDSPGFQGSHTFIKQGAHLITSPDEIMEILGWEKKNNSTHSRSKEVLDCVRLREILSKKKEFSYAELMEEGMENEQLLEMLFLLQTSQEIIEIRPQQYVWVADGKT